MKTLLALCFLQAFGVIHAAANPWISATDEESIRQEGVWRESSFRYAIADSMATQEDGAALEFEFTGTAVAVRLGANNVPAYGVPNLGTLVATVDNGEPVTIHPHVAPREIVLARGLRPGAHKLRIEHRVGANGLAGCRLESFTSWKDPRGSLEFEMNGEENAFLVDARAILRQEKDIVRNSIVRNWLTGRCSLVGLPPGTYFLEVRAAGWNETRLQDVVIEADKTTRIDPVFLTRDPDVVMSRFRFPALNRQAIRKQGESFRARFLGYDTEISEVELSRKVGPAVISRKLKFTEDRAAAHYYDREVIAQLPNNMPPGIYDLTIRINGGKRTGFCRSPRSVHVVREWPRDPVLVTFGHLDTSAQYQAEYLEQIADMANLVGADLVLQSTAVNPAYITGALARLDMPYITNFGNHQFYGHEKWFGDPVECVDFGPDIAILNFGHPWFDRDSINKADVLFSSRAETKIKIINAFEANAPQAFLNRHQVRLIHDAHGLGQKVMTLEGTDTLRVGKTNSVSFRVVRFRQNRVVSATYQGHETKPIPFAREAEPPLKIVHSAPNDGTSRRISTTIDNALLDPYPKGRVTWLLPHGEYRVDGDNAQLESNIASDNSLFSVVTARVDIPASSETIVTVVPED
jgi:hypothetical protein